MIINYNNLFFKIGDSIIKNFNLLKRFCTLYELLKRVLLKQKKNKMR